jgi:hypothetical protein
LEFTIFTIAHLATSFGREAYMCDDGGQGGGSELLIESFATPLSSISQEEENGDQFTNTSLLPFFFLTLLYIL